MQNQSIKLEDTMHDKKTKHDIVLEKLYREAKTNSNTLGFILIGSVATRTHTEKSDLDTITILKSGIPASGKNNKKIDGLHVDDLYFTYHVLRESVENVPYLLYPLVKSKLLYDPENSIQPLVDKITKYFSDNPEMEKEWVTQYDRSKEIKVQSGCRIQGSNATIIDVWNMLERKTKDGKIKRLIFNEFYFTNPYAFKLLKWVMGKLQ
jgi:hypothetical protein